jgi:hypothetical protein
LYALASETTSTTSTSTTMTSTTTTRMTTTVGCAAVWKQCGGRDHKGPLCCEAGSTCSFGNEWYSQCKPISSMLLQQNASSKSRLRKFFRSTALLQARMHFTKADLEDEL